ncbi:FUSC family protein [Cruoricaptor ignavus]|uniref:FUSC family protein n=1 Tax=Cruoricaptor ignavus TaxID=1118202 RepID=A0A7M1T229_9FLAO|nr:FUSC family membrane protein [Cruoricaptor ignavus]QOR73910.1 FUSC family protein [Cruoricaptor ignavus]
MNYQSEFRKFLTSQYLYSGVRIAFAVLLPAIFLYQVGLLKAWFLFPLATSFVANVDQPGPFIRRRNMLIMAIFCFAIVASITTVFRPYPILVTLEIIVFGLFFGILGIYGNRFSAVGGMSLVVMSIFIDGHFLTDPVSKNLIIFILGGIWFLIIFLILMRVQPYKLIYQMIGENYTELADYLRLKAQFYRKNADIKKLTDETIQRSIRIKNHQEDTRETVYKTRQIVREATTTSRQLMMLFLNSIDLHEKLITSENDYRQIHEYFGNKPILNQIHSFLLMLADEISNIGLALQSGNKAHRRTNLDDELQLLYEEYFEIRSQEMNSENLENFMVLRQILQRINELTESVSNIYTIYTQDLSSAKTLSTGLDYEKFLPQQEKLNTKVLRTNISLKSKNFRHAVRLTTALLIAYFISQLSFFPLGHAYWIMITVIAIMRPNFATTKQRNFKRLFGTVLGALAAYIFLMMPFGTEVRLGILFFAMILCYTLLRTRYDWAVFFMTVYVFMSFDFLNPGNVNAIFSDRIFDTAIGAAIAAAVSYFVLPIWEAGRSTDLMLNAAKSNRDYFQIVIGRFLGNKPAEQDFRMKRKNAVIDLANLSDSFRGMISEPKNRQKKMETLHQFVTTAHLLTAYIASLSQYENPEDYQEIDAEGWNRKISAELNRTIQLIENQGFEDEQMVISEPEDEVEMLLKKRKTEIAENDIDDHRNIHRTTKLTRLKHIREVLTLIYNTAKEQRKVLKTYYESKG